MALGASGGRLSRGVGGPPRRAWFPSTSHMRLASLYPYISPRGRTGVKTVTISQVYEVHEDNATCSRSHWGRGWVLLRLQGL